MGGICADLHMHSTLSDGLHSPEALSELIVNKGLKAFSLTDHDTVDGLSRITAGEGVTFIPGLELTSTHNGTEVHILGYYFDPKNPELLGILKEIGKKRVERLLGMVEDLNSSGKTRIDTADMVKEFGEGSYNRLNLARYLVKKGAATSIDHCFTSFIGEDSKSYRPVDFFSPKDAIKLIQKAGGLAFLAHPYTQNIPGIIPELVEYGLAGLEAFHPSHTPQEVRNCLEWADRLKLGLSGGSDFHGNKNSPRQILSAGLDGERLVDFLALRPDRDMVTA